jgi:hypothetical protein
VFKIALGLLLQNKKYIGKVGRRFDAVRFWAEKSAD